MLTTRFAPSPSGQLHLGHAFAALFAHRAARDNGGRFMLRMEDIDVTRCKPEFEQAIIEDLKWLGLDWDGPIVRQSENFTRYKQAIDQLEQRGLVYPCFCTRQEIAAEIARSARAPHGPEGPVYPGTCRDLTASETAQRLDKGQSYARRLNMARARAAAAQDLSFTEHGSGGNEQRVTLDSAPFGDIVLARKDMPTSYHVAVVLDDAAQGITTVTRGLDLFPATAIHRLLQSLWKLPVPDYCHHRLITDDTGKRLATRDAAHSLKALRAQGMTATEIKEKLGF